MQALLFLTSRSFYNGIKRAVTSGRRLFTLLFAIAYYAFLVFRPMGRSGRGLPQGLPHYSFSSSEADVIIFAFYAVMSLMLMISFLAPRSGFRQSDVDVLFPTPVSPRLVMLLRLIRDYLFTLLTPLILLVFGGRNSIMVLQGFLAGMSSNGPLVRTVGALAWLLMSFAFVTMGYAVGFFVNRSDLLADRNKKIIDRTVFAIVIGTALYFVVNLRSDLSWSTAMRCAQSLPVRSVFFCATAATRMVTGAFQGDLMQVASGITILVLTSVASLWIALTQIPFMYDQAAVKGFGSSELLAMRRNNDMYGLIANQAKSGKVKVGRFSRWIGSMRFKGASALVWKEILLQLRGAKYLYLIFGPLQILMTLGPVFALSEVTRKGVIEATGSVILVMQAVSVLMVTMNSAVSGFTELLKRVDFQKPLPFRPSSTVFWEIASKCIPNLLFAVISSLLVIAFRPVLWDFSLASLILVLGFSLLVSGTVFLVTIAFPDAGDASQRGFRGILILLGMVILGAPGAGLFSLLHYLLHVDPIIAAIPASGLSIGLTLIVSYFSGLMYDTYNPSE